MKTASEIKEKCWARIGLMLRRRILIKLTWIPGVRPVIIPAKIPKPNAMII